MLLSIGDNFPPYLPATKASVAQPSEAAAESKSRDVRRELMRESPKSLAMAHAELRRFVD
jgi:hypothetical protein